MLAVPLANNWVIMKWALLILSYVYSFLAWKWGDCCNQSTLHSFKIIFLSACTKDQKRGGSMMMTTSTYLWSMAQHTLLPILPVVAYIVTYSATLLLSNLVPKSNVLEYLYNNWLELYFKTLLCWRIYGIVSVTRLGDLFNFGQLFKAFGNNLFDQISHNLRHVKSIILQVKSFLVNFL